MNEQFVAAKIIQLDEKWAPEEKDSFTEHLEREMLVHKALDHPNIVKFIKFFQLPDKKSSCAIMELCEGPDLFVHEKRNSPLSEDDGRAIIRAVVAAIRHLHSKNVIHYDLKPQNILFQNVCLISRRPRESH